MDGTIHSGPSPHTSIINFKNAPQTCPLAVQMLCSYFGVILHMHVYKIVYLYVYL